MSYKEMKKLAKSLSTYKVPRLTLFGNAVNLVANKDGDQMDSEMTRRSNGNNNGNNNGNS